MSNNNSLGLHIRRFDESDYEAHNLMAILTNNQRSQFSKVVLQARDAAEKAADKALHSLGVDECQESKARLWRAVVTPGVEVSGGIFAIREAGQ
jgi:hypothetical protein